MFTGTAEAVAFGDTIETVLHLQPDVETIYVYGAPTPTWKHNKQLFIKESQDFSGRVKLEIVEGLDIPKAREHIARVGPRSAVLLTSVYRDEHGELTSFEKSTAEISQAAPVPVYGFWDFQLGSGIVGGKLISGVAQGETAARMTLRLLQGEAISDIPIITESPNRHLFDYQALEQVGLLNAPLPKYSEIINQPISFYGENKGLVWAAIGVITLLSCIIAALVVNILQWKKAQAYLAASEESYRSIFNAANDPIIVLDALTGRIQDVNDAMLKQFGVTYEKALNLTIGEMSDVESGFGEKKAREMLGLALENGRHVFEWRSRRKDGSTFWSEVALRYTAIRGEPRILALVRDITERKQADELFRQTLEFLPVAVAVTSGETVDYVNRKFADMLGYELEDIRDLSMWWPKAYPNEVYRKQALKDWTRAVGDAIAFGKESELLEYQVRCADGSKKDIEFLFLPLGEGGITTFVDVTERNRSNNEVVRQRAILSSVINSVPDLIFYKNLDGLYLGCNQALAEVVGVGVDKVVGKTSLDLFPRLLAESIAERDNMAISSLKTQVHEEIVSYPDGRTVELEIQVTPMIGESGDLIGLAGVGRDVSVRKVAEQKLEQLVSELEDKNAELERFTYTVSHDLKSPIITIAGFVGLLKHDLGNGKVEAAQKGLGRIEQAAHRMAQLLDELLQLSRIGRGDYPMTDVDLGEVAMEAADLAAGRLTASGGHVVIAEDLPVVHADKIRLREVFMNLIDNAAKFTPDGLCPHIEIGVRQESGKQVFFVADNGIGIPTPYKERVFNLFEQLDPKLEGTGIGLALVKRIVAHHNGTIWVESEGEGEGASFCFTLGG